MNILNVPFKQLGSEHILKLIGTQENDSLDFKREAYKDTDSDKFEMCKDISSFSNAQGGLIVIGISEENDTAKEIVHVPNADLEIERIENVLLSSVYERIPMLKICKVTIAVTDESKDVIVISIPKSLRAPHMVKRQNKTSFFKRYGRRILEMPIDEIKEAVLKSYSYISDVETFIEKRKETAISRITNFPEKTGHLVLLATPQYLSEQAVDVESKNVQDAFSLNPSYTEKYPNRRTGGWIIMGNTHTKPSLYGLLSDDYRRVELFRNGHLEAHCVFDDFVVRKKNDYEKNEKQVLNFRPICEYVVSFIYLANHIYQLSGIYNPYIFNLLIANCENYHLPTGHMFFSRYGEKTLEIPSQIVDASKSPENIAQPILDRVWQAFGIWKSPAFVDGQLNFSERGFDW